MEYYASLQADLKKLLVSVYLSNVVIESSRNEKERSMPGEDNARLVADFLDELWNQGSLAIIDQLTAEDYVVHIPQGDLLGREALKAVVKFYFERFSSISVGIEQQTSQDSQVVTRIEWDIALNLRVQPFVKEINRKIPARGVSIDRIDNGQIAESWNMLDMLYSLYNIQELSRDPNYVRILLSVKNCPPCPAGQTCIQDHCKKN